MESLPLPLMLISQRLPFDDIIVILIPPNRASVRVDGLRAGRQGRSRGPGRTGSRGFRSGREDEVGGRVGVEAGSFGDVWQMGGDVLGAVGVAVGMSFVRGVSAGAGGFVRAEVVVVLVHGLLRGDGPNMPTSRDRLAALFLLLGTQYRPRALIEDPIDLLLLLPGRGRVQRL